MSNPRTKLDPRHPDFTPVELFPPRRLFCASVGSEDDSASPNWSDQEPFEPVGTALIPKSLEAAFRRAAGTNDDAAVEADDMEDEDQEYDDVYQEEEWYDDISSPHFSP